MKRSRFEKTYCGLLSAAGFFMFSSLLMAEEVTIKNASVSVLNVEGKTDKGVPGIVTYMVDDKTTVEVVGKPLKVVQLQPGWKVDIASGKPKNAGKDSKAKLATKITVKCDWLEGTLNGKPTDSGVSVATKIDDKPTNASVIFFPGMETKNLGDKKLKELTKGTKVEMQVITGSMPPIVVTLQIPAPPTPAPSPTPTKTPIPIKLPPTAIPTAPPASAPATPPASAPAAPPAAGGEPVASQPAGAPSAAPVAVAPASAPAAPVAPGPDAGGGEFQVNFDKGLPNKWEQGVAAKENLPEGSQGAVTAKVVDGAAETIVSNMEWEKGHFTVENDLYVNFRLRMTKPEWFQFFIFVKDKGPTGENSLNYESKPDVTGMKPGEWKVISVPIADFKSITGAKAGSPPPAGQICWKYFWDTQKRDLGLSVDRVWITKGKPGDVPPPVK